MSAEPQIGDSPNTRVNRILYVEANEDGTVGGSHVCLFDVARNLDPGRFQPIVLFYQQNRYVDELRNLGIEVHVWDDVRQREHRMYQAGSIFTKTYLQFAAILRRYRFLKKHQIDLVALNNAITTSFDDWLPGARLAGIPCVCHSRGQGAIPGRRVLWWLMTRFDRVIVMSEYLGDLVRGAGVPAARVVRVYDSIDTARFLKKVTRPAAAVRKDLGIGDDLILMVMVAHIRFWKGQDAVLSALSRMDPTVRERVRVAFVGGTPKRDASYAAGLHATVAREGLANNVMFLGERSDVPDLSNAADVMIHAATEPEPFGLVVLEAMALGKPLVAAKLGGPAEIVTPGSGLPFDPKDPEALARILERLVAEPTLRETLRQGALARVKEFSLRRTLDETQGVYAEVLGGGPAQGSSQQ